MLPEAAIPACFQQGQILPAFLNDRPWLHVLMDEIDRFRGRPRWELEQRLRERRCSDGEIPPHARLVYFRRRIDPAAVLAALAMPGQTRE